MTEEEWLGVTDPEPMLEYCTGCPVSQRKFRLFTVACFRRLWHLLTDERLEEAVRTAELVVDGLCDEEALGFARAAVLRVPTGHAAWLPACVDGIRWLIIRHPSYPRDAMECAAFARSAAARYARSGKSQTTIEAAEQEAQAQLLRDIVGNPFEPVWTDPVWLTEDVVDQARNTYDGRTFGRLPALADALEDAGCESAELLGHLRGPEPHARGCWALDLILGKE